MPIVNPIRKAYAFLAGLAEEDSPLSEGGKHNARVISEALKEILDNEKNAEKETTEGRT